MPFATPFHPNSGLLADYKKFGKYVGIMDADHVFASVDDLVTFYKQRATNLGWPYQPWPIAEVEVSAPRRVNSGGVGSLVAIWVLRLVEE
jgi:hypothetical protein